MGTGKISCPAWERAMKQSSRSCDSGWLYDCHADVCGCRYVGIGQLCECTNRFAGLWGWGVHDYVSVTTCDRCGNGHPKAYVCLVKIRPHLWTLPGLALFGSLSSLKLTSIVILLTGIALVIEHAFLMLWVCLGGCQWMQMNCSERWMKCDHLQVAVWYWEG